MMESKKSYDFKAGEILLVDKPLEWTSFDVVNKLRWEIKRKLGVKKIKVGHAGTLDPLATGLLIICTGKMTKQINNFINDDKAYTGTIRLGATTPSYDLETEIDAEYDLDSIGDAEIKEAVKQLTGGIMQTPPIFSAKKIRGKKAYDSARAGQEVRLAPVPVNIAEFKVDTSTFPDIQFSITCSKGTYIRSLAHDLGQILKCGGHLTALRRTRSGEFSINDAKTIDEWIETIREN